ncbi:MAG TPA: hypothetical protein VMV69_18665 [Pirellulales bacterium]|nr:hypothetical protein [Pirellulales bacterium]
MTTTPATHVPSPRRAAPPAVRWRSWPIAEGGWPVGWLSALAAGVVAAVGLTTASVGWSVAAGGLLAAAAWRCFVPIEIEINAQGVSQEYFGRRRRILWKAVATYEMCRAGLWLAPASGRRPFDCGLYLPWGAHRAEVEALVDYYLPRDDPPRDDSLYHFDVNRAS